MENHLDVRIGMRATVRPPAHPRVSRRPRACAWMVVAALLCPSAAQAWGFDAHKFIMDRAIGLLPAGLRPMFERHRAVAVERSIDPDIWIVTGGFDEESPRHFLNLDADRHGPYPFAALPRELEAAVAKFGEAHMRRNGTLPWRAEEFFDRLRAAFASSRLRTQAGELDAIRLASALSHYVADAHVPFHAITNYDGQLTSQRGIHARFETALFVRYEPMLRVTPPRVVPLRSARDAVFDALLDGTRLAPEILRADRAATRTPGVYDDTYYETFFRATRPVLERRLGESITAVAAAIAGAWEAAGPGSAR